MLVNDDDGASDDFAVVFDDKRLLAGRVELSLYIGFGNSFFIERAEPKFGDALKCPLKFLDEIFSGAFR